MKPRDLTHLEQLLLYAVTHLQNTGNEPSGTSIRRVIHVETGRTLSPGAIYTCLDRLERRGCVRSALGDPTPERGGKRKRRYVMRPAGADALRSAEATLGRMVRLARAKG